MLLSFSFKNFLSYKEESQLIMTTIKSFKELKKTNTFIQKDYELLKTSVIFGSNGGGKSNFIKAMYIMKTIIHNSFAESLKKEEERGDTDFFFKLNKNCEEEPTFFEVVFIKNLVTYRYGFEIKGFTIISEWLFQKKDTETLLFDRKKDKYKINKNSFSEGLKYKDSINENVLFLSYLAQNNTNISSEIFDWFKNFNVITALNNKGYENATKQLLKKDERFKIWLSYAVKFLNITNVQIDNNGNIISYHNKYDENDFIIDSIPFEIDLYESEGTKKLIYLLGAIYDTLVNKKILIIDELDSKLHPILTKKIISFFHEFNIKNSQFVFTVHDSDLLDKKIFRRDQIWFIDKNKFGASELYSLSDFDASVVRNSSDFRKKYLELTFGAADSIDITQNLIDLMYETRL